MTYITQNLKPSDHLELSRRAELNKLIRELFGELAPDEIEILQQDYDQSHTLMVEVSRVRPQSSTLTDLFDDTEFRPVRFPPSLLPYLKKHDVFLATIGYKDAAWSIIYLGPRYDTDTF